MRKFLWQACDSRFHQLFTLGIRWGKVVRESSKTIRKLTYNDWHLRLVWTSFLSKVPSLITHGELLFMKGHFFSFIGVHRRNLYRNQDPRTSLKKFIWKESDGREVPCEISSTGLWILKTKSLKMSVLWTRRRLSSRIDSKDRSSESIEQLE